jgi:hypothetical protein
MVKLELECGVSVLVDEQDVGLISSHHWRLSHKKKYRESGATYRYLLSKQGALHRLIMAPIAGQVVDHINGDIYDNRRSNLRLCTNAENIRNAQKRCIKKATSKFKGVGFDSNRNRWRATITVDWKTKHLGYFDSEEDAAKAYDIASEKYHGEFGRKNFLEQ